MRRTTRVIVRFLDGAARRWLKADETSEHIRIGVRGEEDAYFRLREPGYVIVARNFRSPRCHGEIDLIEWEGDILCFIEVKTRTSPGVKTAAAGDRRSGAVLCVRKAPLLCQWRFDVVSVYYDGRSPRPQIEVFRNASLAA